MAEAIEDFALLLTRVRQGDEAALAQLLRQYEPKVRLAARTLLGPALRRYLDSIDVAQSVHLTLLRGLRQEKFAFAGPDALVALALVLVRRKVARQWRRAQREQRFCSQVASGHDPRALLVSLCSAAADPARAAEFHEAVEQFWQSLNETERRLMDLRLQGYSTAEIAAELGIAANVSRVFLSRARRRLRERGIFEEWL